MHIGSPARPSLKPVSLPVIIFLLLLAFYFRAVPHTLDPLRTTNADTQFDTARALERLARVLDGTPHPADSDALQQMRERLLREIRAMGYAPEIREHTSCVTPERNTLRCAQVQNLFFRAGNGEGPVLLLTAHYDSWDVSPGFADDGIGIAVWLEVAQLLREQAGAARPAVFLFTDGEELDLLGARAFAGNRSDYDFAVGRVINLEARGTRGPALMFETSNPNGAIVHDWAQNGARRFSNSMMTAIYKLLPNSTDLSVHLASGSAGINIALADGVNFYHTSRDDLAMLDRASVQHMGDQALGAVRAFLTSNWNGDSAGGDIVYSDILSRVFVALPQPWAQGLVLLCFAAAVVLLLRPTRAGHWRKPDWRALAVPPLLFATAAVLAYLLPLLVRVLRAEPVYWMAYPQALAMTIFITTVLAAMLSLMSIAPRLQPHVLFMAGCCYLLGIGVLLSIAIPGFTMIFLIPGAVMVIAGVAIWFAPRLQTAGHVLACAVLVSYFFPLIQLIEIAMGLAMPAMFGAIEAMVLAPMLALLQRSHPQHRIVVPALAVVALVSLALTILVPAYDEDHPLPVNFIAHYDTDQRSAVLASTAATGSLPGELGSQFVTGEFELPRGISNRLPGRALQYRERASATVTLLEEMPMQNSRRLTVQLSAADARGVRLTIPAQAKPLRIHYRSQIIEVPQNLQEDFIAEIFGREVDGAVLQIELATPDKTDFVIQGIWTGLPPDAQPIAAQRPASSVRIQIGDITITTKTQNL